MQVLGRKCSEWLASTKRASTTKPYTLITYITNKSVGDLAQQAGDAVVNSRFYVRLQVLKIQLSEKTMLENTAVSIVLMTETTCNAEGFEPVLVKRLQALTAQVCGNAGFETSAHTLAWALFELAANPKLQASWIL